MINAAFLTELEQFASRLAEIRSARAASYRETGHAGGHEAREEQ